MSGTPHQRSPVNGPSKEVCQSTPRDQMIPRNEKPKKRCYTKPLEALGQIPTQRNLRSRMLPRRILVTQLPYPDTGSQAPTEHLEPPARNNLKDATYVHKSSVLIQPVESQSSSDESDQVISKESLQQMQDAIELETYLHPFLHEKMTLPQFVQIFGPYTKDKGKLLCEVMDDELHMFRYIVKNIFRERMLYMRDTLAERQLEGSKLQKTEFNVMKIKTNDVLEALKLLVPDFDWNEYHNNPNYLQDYFSSSKPTKEPDKNEEESYKDIYCIKALHMMTFVEEELMGMEEEEAVQHNTLSKLREDNAERQCVQAAEMTKLRNESVLVRSRLIALRDVRRDLISAKNSLMARGSYTDAELGLEDD